MMFGFRFMCKFFPFLFHCTGDLPFCLFLFLQHRFSARNMRTTDIRVGSTPQHHSRSTLLCNHCSLTGGVPVESVRVLSTHTHFCQKRKKTLLDWLPHRGRTLHPRWREEARESDKKNEEVLWRWPAGRWRQ